MKIGPRHFIAALTVLTLCGLLTAQDKPSSSGTTAPMSKAVVDMAQAATNFWAALSPEQQAKAGLDFTNDMRQTWHFVPSPRPARVGLTIKEMTSGQRALAYAFLSSGLSQKGLAQALTIMSLDDVLKELEAGTPSASTRNPELYYFSIYGKPDGKDPWGWKVEGHHVSMNFTIIDGKTVAVGPAFLGANPATIKDGPRKGLRILGTEEDMGRALVKALTDAQRKTATLPGAAPGEIVTGPSRKAMLDNPAGIAYPDLTGDQQKMLVDLVREYAGRLRGELAEQDMMQITMDGWDKVKFAWAGGLELGQPHYYRVFGPGFLIEYDNTQNNANHVHSVWRDLKNDFGGDVLAKHYQDTPHEDVKK